MGWPTSHRNELWIEPQFDPDMNSDDGDVLYGRSHALTLGFALHMDFITFNCHNPILCCILTHCRSLCLIVTLTLAHMYLTAHRMLTRIDRAVHLRP